MCPVWPELPSMAGANELALASLPGHGTAEMRADRRHYLELSVLVAAHINRLIGDDLAPAIALNEGNRLAYRAIAFPKLAFA